MLAIIAMILAVISIGISLYSMGYQSGVQEATKRFKKAIANTDKSKEVKK